MNKIIGALVLAVVIVVLLYAGFTKVMTLSAENETLKQNVITLTQTNEQNLKAISEMKELSTLSDSLTLQLKHMSEVQPVATQTVVEKEKLPKSVIEPWFNLNVESSDKTAGGALDLILRLRGELQKAGSQLSHIRENY